MGVLVYFDTVTKGLCAIQKLLKRFKGFVLLYYSIIKDQVFLTLRLTS